MFIFLFSLACTPEESEDTPATTTIYQGPLGSPYTDQYGIEFVWIEPGSFDMGALVGEGPDDGGVSLPVHEVIISKGFYLGKYEVTQGQVDLLSEDYTYYFPSTTVGSNNPIDSFNSQDTPLNLIDNSNNFNSTNTYLYRLPTEAEWEYAARAGTDTLFYWGDDTTMIDAYEWSHDNAYSTTQVVGQLLPNPWGFHDMLGNVREFTSDRYNGNELRNGYEDIIRVFDDPATDPWWGGGSLTPEYASGDYVIRGGAASSSADTSFYCSSRRLFDYQDHVGLRLVLDVYAPASRHSREGGNL